MPKNKDQVVVLLAPGFREGDVVTVTESLRLAGRSVVLVGLTAGPIRGDLGVAVVPDASLTAIGERCPDAVVIPGGVRGVQQLDADPRVHALLQRVVAQQGIWVAVGDAGMILQGRDGASAGQCAASAQHAAGILAAWLAAH